MSSIASLPVSIVLLTVGWSTPTISSLSSCLSMVSPQLSLSIIFPYFYLQSLLTSLNILPSFYHLLNLSTQLLPVSPTAHSSPYSRHLFMPCYTVRFRHCTLSLSVSFYFSLWLYLSTIQATQTLSAPDKLWLGWVVLIDTESSCSPLSDIQQNMQWGEQRWELELNRAAIFTTTVWPVWKLAPSYLY